MLDDLGVGLERLGKSTAAVRLLRGKLADQRRLGLTGRDLYTTSANLGTFLIHDSLGPATRGDPPAREEFKEGIAFIRQAVAVNPEAHFGRERWQAAIAEFLLAALADSQILRTFDCLGNRLDLPIESILNREAHWVEHGGYGRPTSPGFSRWRVNSVPLFFQTGVKPGDPALWDSLHAIRAEITTVGAEEGWENVAVPSHQIPVPFDEPTLGIIGMWREGGGANPHFALALGETMLRVGQRRLAWAAFERAGRLADRFWPDPALVQGLRDHCRSRQAEIVSTLADRSTRQGSQRQIPWQQVSPPHDGDSPAQLRARFAAELRFGESYPARLQAYERTRIAAGASVLDPDFEVGFPAGPIPIASPVGPEEWFVGIPPAKLKAYGAEHAHACGVCGAGLAALATALVLRIRARSFVPAFQAVTSGQEQPHD